MPDYLDRARLQVAPALAQLIEDSILPGLDVSAEQFWTGFAGLVSDLAPRNRALLEERARLQEALDAWHRERRGAAWDPTEYRAFLEEIGYLVPDVPPFEIATVAVDPEIAAVAGPQLVVPVMNPRFALNAANARWGSLYDALYGTDAISGTPQGPGYDPQRGARVVAWAAAFLDDAVPLEDASHRAVTAYRRDGARLVATLEDGQTVGLAEPSQFVGFAQDQSRTSYVMRHHGLHIELVIDPASDVGRESPSGLRDVVLESALTVIQDCEDSVAAVDAEDKVVVYANWLGLMKGDLVDRFEKGGRTVTRRLNPDRELSAPGGGQLTLPGRALMLVRNVGDLMTTDAVRDAEGREIPEAFLDAAVTVLAAMHDLKKTEGLRNSRTGSIYVVKPKMHGPEEAAFADTLFGRVEDMLGLARNTVKLGLMDEERRTSANLRASIRAIKDRIVFINTGFLDRTGDEIHTSMQAGPVIPKGEMKDAPWLLAYEDGNVDAGLAAGMEGRGQIGKGMWAKPDAMAEMLATKQAHPEAGANTAWVPSPTAATLHAVHYHQVDVPARQDALKGRAPADAAALLTPPLLDQRNLSDEAVAREIDNNCQSILGYVVRWVDQGIGCSKVPDINDVALMEDRATLRISAQFLANWIAHGVTSREAVEASLRRMAAAVDRQNAGDPAYKPMAGDPDGSIAFQAARDLIFEGLSLPSGYTEPVLHRRRREAKAAQSAAPASEAAPKQARA